MAHHNRYRARRGDIAPKRSSRAARAAAFRERESRATTFVGLDAAARSVRGDDQ